MSNPVTEYRFENAEEALKWAVEVLRRRRLPKISSFWRETEAEAEWMEQVWTGPKNLTLPKDGDERMHLALRVMEALEKVGTGQGRTLQLWAMGDWADDGRLAAALAIQERMRREGVRVRLAYRYTYEQLGTALGCDRKTAWRKVQGGLLMLGERLAEAGLVDMVGGTEPVTDNFKKNVYLYDFKN